MPTRPGAPSPRILRSGVNLVAASSKPGPGHRPVEEPFPALSRYPFRQARCGVAVTPVHASARSWVRGGASARTRRPPVELGRWIAAKRIALHPSPRRLPGASTRPSLFRKIGFALQRAPEAGRPDAGVAQLGGEGSGAAHIEVTGASGPSRRRAGLAEQARGSAEESARAAAIRRDGRVAHDVPGLIVSQIDLCRDVVIGAAERKRQRARSVEDRRQHVVAAALARGGDTVQTAGERTVVIAAVAVDGIPVVAFLAWREDAIGTGGEDVRLAIVLVSVADDRA